MQVADFQYLLRGLPVWCRYRLSQAPDLAGGLAAGEGSAGLPVEGRGRKALAFRTQPRELPMASPKIAKASLRTATVPLRAVRQGMQRKGNSMCNETIPITGPCRAAQATGLAGGYGGISPKYPARPWSINLSLQVWGAVCRKQPFFQDRSFCWDAKRPLQNGRVA